VQIKPGKVQNIAITVDQKRKDLRSLNESNFIETDDKLKNNIQDDVGSITSQLVRIEFFDQSMRAIPRINLDQPNNTMIHRVFIPQQIDSTLGALVQKQNLLQQKLPREFYVIKSTLENQKRILTVRTQFIIVNKTEINYSLRIFWIDKQNKKVKVISEEILEKGAMTSLPDNSDKDMQQKMKISVKPEFS
jgi:hypothetical protein